MKISEQWLREWIDPPVDSDTLAQQLTMAGLEVNSIEPACKFFSGLVVAEVVKVNSHPDADKLRICQVNSGEEVLTIVCAAANVREGMKTVLAKAGAILPDGKALEPTELKGVLSEGMLCSAKEIGLGDDSDSIMELSIYETVGEDVAIHIHADDTVIELSLTPNRGDCLSVKGVARETAASNKMPFREPKIEPVSDTSTVRQTINVEATAACPRYLGRVIEAVDCSVMTPLWMSERLRRVGIRSINIIVDITNLVMLELGQPMHAFDHDRLHGVMSVRFAADSEAITLLDKTEHQLSNETLVIADEKGAVALAGIMGGLESAVQMDSQRLLLESAFFSPQAIIGRARYYGLHTDSSHRFERGVDPQLQHYAMNYAASLILKYCGGKSAPITESLSVNKLPANQPVTVRRDQIEKVLGMQFNDEFIRDAFHRLGFDVNSQEKQYNIVAPSARFDINTEADLIEELARLYGYDPMPVTFPATSLKICPPDIFQLRLQNWRSALVNRDYQEIISYSFVDPEVHKLLNIKDNSMMLSNPIAPEMSAMRMSLWPGLLSTLKYNQQRQQHRIRLFESGNVFVGRDEPIQEIRIAGLIYGNKYKKQWHIDDILSDIYDIKLDVEALLHSSLSKTQTYQYVDADLPMLHPGQSFGIQLDDVRIGVVGQLHPAVRASLGLSSDVHLFEIYLENMPEQKRIECRPISRFPSVTRDISIVVDDNISLEIVIAAIKASAAESLTNLELFDVYQGEGIEIGKKSLALGLTFQASSSTLKDKEVATIMEKVISGLYVKFGAKLRE